jgi:hypothetical protein
VVNSADRAKLKKFEDVVLKNEEVGIALKLFRCIKVDLARDKIAKSMYGNKVPRFIAYDTKGKIINELYIAGYRSKTGPLMNLLLKASRGHGKLPLKTFISKYRSFLNELDKLENKKSTLAKKKARLLGPARKPATAAARAGALGATSRKPRSKKLSKRDQAKVKKVEKEEKVLVTQITELKKQEEKLLADVKAYSNKPPTKAEEEKAKPAPGGG